ncbi:MAG TPA: isoprenylcysteine carboxylmethyltransferase family protein [Thermoanaerobaculia bacterium]|nr:isoprenylcysteine carboxylmethyltransferase family protein [Thermoanaerobaculia bacterium]
MRNPDLLLYAVHVAFWGSFGLTRSIARTPPAGPAAPVGEAPTAQSEETAPFSRALLFLHMVAFGVMYFGVANAVLPNRVPEWFAGQRIVGLAVIAAGAFLMSWALVSFRSWRFRAKLDQGHQLATGGPFRLLRHPIYAGLNLLALGTAVWVPTPTLWIGFALMVLGSDLRGRSEEALLMKAFGPTYADYCKHAKRFIPGVY